ncbi:uncharacterized protein BP01DRAFT_155719 [Aspergillus saccharolyticus JOP 1030-1]|uniref:Uncharacterized protein n=1 Tax=Aspergillus saccharolyticus JOP 1030-1 TaxID=1450539 RepID=A0A319A392_9EURO|nr:hypothetical protein BP01DRAFT_155719 [Aspergillus saccharolyticus JOP 1030-1]PYH41932.1 hypothetical protein BP01DRAFT_155719 [Aspergillus saccharolyticus JOP 1030-1]
MGFSSNYGVPLLAVAACSCCSIAAAAAAAAAVTAWTKPCRALFRGFGALLAVFFFFLFFAFHLPSFPLFPTIFFPLLLLSLSLCLSHSLNCLTHHQFHLVTFRRLTTSYFILVLQGPDSGATPLWSSPLQPTSANYQVSTN